MLGLQPLVERGTVREFDQTDTLADNEKLRDTLLRYEQDDFAELCRLIRAEKVRACSGGMIVVVAKADLYWDRLGEVGDYYLPGADPVADMLGGLVAGDTTVPPRIADRPVLRRAPGTLVRACNLYSTPSGSTPSRPRRAAQQPVHRARRGVVADRPARTWSRELSGAEALLHRCRIPPGRHCRWRRPHFSSWRSSGSPPRSRWSVGEHRPVPLAIGIAVAAVVV